MPRAVASAAASPATAEALARTQADLATCEAQLAASQAEMEALTAYCRAVEQRAGELQQALTEVRIPPLDIVICLDITGSMSDQIQGLKQEIDDLARVLDRLAPSVGIGVVAYGDRLFDRVTENTPSSARPRWARCGDSCKRWNPRGRRCSATPIQTCPKRWTGPSPRPRR